MLAYLAAGRTETEVREDFPAVTRDGIRAALVYAADIGGAEQVVTISIPR